MAAAKAFISIGMEFPAIKQPNSLTKNRWTRSIDWRTAPGNTLARSIRRRAETDGFSLKNRERVSQARSYGCVRTLLHRSHSIAVDLNTPTFIPFAGRFFRLAVCA